MLESLIDVISNIEVMLKTKLNLSNHSIIELLLELSPKPIFLLLWQTTPNWLSILTQSFFIFIKEFLIYGK